MRYALFACFVLSTNALQGQLHVLSVLPNPENSQTEFRITHSLGEPFVQQQKIAPYFVTEGFQQGEVQLASLSKSPDKQIQISITPNPASDFLLVSSSDKDILEMEIIVLRTDGIPVQKQRIVPNNTIVYIGDLIPGSYIIKGFSLAGTQIAQHTIVKI